MTYDVDWRATEKSGSKWADIRGIATITVDDVNQNFKLALKEKDTQLKGVAPGWHPFTVIAKNTAGTKYNP